MATFKLTKKRDVFHGLKTSDSIYGFGGNDDLYGAGGNDTLRGGSGNDKLFGEAGNDKLYGEAGNDTMNGAAGKDHLDGGSGNDKLDGGIGNDTLKGGTGNDTLYGGAGADKFNGGTGTDVADFSAVTNSAAFSLINSFDPLGTATGDTFAGIENIVGTNFGDVFEGTAGKNRIDGRAGNDLLFGLDGADTLIGGDGNDTFVPGSTGDADIVLGGDGIDTVNYNGSSGVTINLSTNTVADGAANDVLVSIENIIGSQFADDLTASVGGTVLGAGGNDRISGSTLPDRYTSERLEGGTGADSFVVLWASGVDFIVDFTPGLPLGAAGDTLIIESAEFNGITHQPDVNGASTALVNISGGAPIAATRNSTQFIFDQTSSILYVDWDGTGSAHAPIPVANLNGYDDPLTHGGPLFSVDEFQII